MHGCFAFEFRTDFARQCVVYRAHVCEQCVRTLNWAIDAIEDRHIGGFWHKREIAVPIMAALKRTGQSAIFFDVGQHPHFRVIGECVLGQMVNVRLAEVLGKFG